MTVLLPRLPGPVAGNMLEQFLRNGVDAWPGFDPQNLPEGVRFAPTGGSQIATEELRKLRTGLCEIAETSGLTNSASREAKAVFDAQAGAWLYSMSFLNGGEALRDDFWAFVSVAIAPDLVHRRFGGSRKRYFGGIRNTFQRLWMRAYALDRGEETDNRWELLSALSEDALVQITERPSLGGDPVLAREVAEGWVRAASHYGQGAMETVMRRAALRIRIRNEIRSLGTLPAEELRMLIDKEFGIE